MIKTIAKQQGRIRRHARIRSRVTGTAARPRLALFKSNRFLYAQLINDDSSTTMASVDTRKLTGTTVERAAAAGKSIAEAAKKAGVEAVVFDRGGFKYQGAIATFADAARGAGLQF